MLLEGKVGVVLGVANKRSIAWGIAQAAAREGARLALTYQGERLEENVRELSEGLKDPVLFPCDVTRDEDLDRLAVSLREQFVIQVDQPFRHPNLRPYMIVSRSIYPGRRVGGRSSGTCGTVQL